MTPAVQLSINHSILNFEDFKFSLFLGQMIQKSEIHLALPVPTALQIGRPTPILIKARYSIDVFIENKDPTYVWRSNINNLLDQK